MTGRYKSLLLAVGIISFVVLTPAPSHAQWWSARAPADFEECSELAEKAATKEAKASVLSECHSKFAGRRKPGGGYSYFDFMQNRHFDIAGANPTPEEQKYIDEQYTAYLDQQRRSIIAAAFTEKQRQLQQAAPQNEKRIVAPEVPRKPPRVAVHTAPARVRSGGCASDSFSCNWPRLAEGIKDLKKLLGSSSDKTKRSRRSTEIAASNP